MNRFQVKCDACGRMALYGVECCIEGERLCESCKRLCEDIEHQRE